MKKFLLITFSLFFIQLTVHAQSLQLLKKDKTPVVNDTIMVSGSADDTEIKVPVYVKNIAGVDKDVYVKRYIKQMVDGSQTQFCWISCFDITTSQSTEHLTIAVNDTAKDFYSLYKPKEFLGVTEIMYTFFVNKAETDSASVTITYEIVSTGIGNLAEIKNSIRCYPNPAIETVYFDYNIENTVSSSIIIYDLVGNKVKQIKISNLSRSKEIDISNLNTGIYIWTFESDGIPIKSDRLIKR